MNLPDIIKFDKVLTKLSNGDLEILVGMRDHRYLQILEKAVEGWKLAYMDELANTPSKDLNLDSLKESLAVIQAFSSIKRLSEEALKRKRLLDSKK